MIMRTSIFIVLFAWCLSGCDKFLEEKSQSEIRPSTVNDMEKLLEGEAYFNVSDGVVFSYATDIFTDDYGCLPNSNEKYLNEKAKLRYKFTWDSYMFEDNGYGGDITLWKVPYERIKGCNVILDYLDQMDGDDSDREHLRGEALMLRGYYYLMLVNFFGLPYNYGDPEKNPGVPLKLTSGVTDERFKRNSVAECYRQIEKDLLTGTNLMSKYRENRSQKVSRVNYLVGYAYLSRLYLYLEDWERVILYADSVLQERPDLMPFASNTTKAICNSRGTTETLWVMLNTSIGNVTRIKRPYGASVDLEHVYSMDKTDEELDYRGDYASNQNNSNPTSRQVCYLKMGFSTNSYKNEAGKTVYDDYWCAGVVKGFYLSDWCSAGVRNAELYLNRAEGYIRKYMKSGDVGDAQLALNDLNTLRQNRFDARGFVEKTLEDFNGDGQALLEFCWRERRRELCGEGNHRWCDLRRQGMPQVTHVYIDSDNGTEMEYILQKEDPRYALVIPDEIRELNPNLTQN